MQNHKNYESPFSTRYASSEMQYLFSADMKFTTWRALWIALAEAEQREGLAAAQFPAEAGRLPFPHRGRPSL